MPAVKVRISGRVHGVGFRAYVMRLAREYHLRGEVWNASDGSVGVVLESENAGNIDRAVQLMKQGPGRVDSVDSEPLTPDPGHDGFSITTARTD